MAALSNEAYPSGGTVGEVLTNNIATIGENQTLRRARRLSVNKGAVVAYVHNQVTPGMGKIGVLIALESEAPADKLEALGKQLAMHVAAAFPLALNEAGIPADMIERERKIASEKAAESGKPAEVIAKMVDGSVAKFVKENALLNQLFVMDGKTKISDVVAAAGRGRAGGGRERAAVPRAGASPARGGGGAAGGDAAVCAAGGLPPR